MSSPSQPIENIFPPLDDLALMARVLPGPPLELRNAIDRAAAIGGRLRAGGEVVRFESPMDGPLEIELRRLDDDAPIQSLSAAQAIEIACGGALA
jgi:hypothetical protein